MKLNQVRKTQKFWIKRERLLTRLLTWTFAIAALVAFGLLVYEALVIAFKDIPVINSNPQSDGSLTQSQKVEQANNIINVASGITSKFNIAVSSTIVMCALIGGVFISRAIANQIHIVAAAHDNKTIIPSNGIYWMRVAKYVLSIIAGGCIAAGFMYLAFSFIQPEVAPIQNAMNQTNNIINDIKLNIPANGIDKDWLTQYKDGASITNEKWLEDQFNNISSELTNSFDTVKQNGISNNVLVALCIIAGGIGLSLINQIVLGSITLSMTKGFQSTNTFDENQMKDDNKEQEEVKNDTPVEESAPVEETAAEETTPVAEQEAEQEAAPVESSEPDSLAKEASEITKKNKKSKNEKK